MKDDRRYDETQAREIFERAASTDVEAVRADPSGTGMTLRELQEIGAEVGLSAEAITTAAISLDAKRATGQTSHLGLPVGVTQSVALGRSLSEDDWDRLVVRLRQTFNARGKVEQGGRFREWWNGNLRVSVEPTPTGDVLHMSTLKSGVPQRLWFGLALTAVGGVMAVGLTLSGALFADVGNLMAMAMLGGGGLATLFGTTVTLPRWARTRTAQFEGLAHALLREGPAPDVLGTGVPDALSGGDD